MSPKASFDEQYTLYSPKSYVGFFLRDLSYRLPFESMALLGDYLNRLEPDTKLETAIVGSCHGLDAAVLKYGYTYDDILKYWLEGDPEKHLFYGGNPRYQPITMIDINEAPLRFAKQVGLCDRYYRCNMQATLPHDLACFLQEKVDLLIAVGITTYLGMEHFQRLVQLVESGQARYLCFSLPSFIRNAYIDMFSESALTLKVLGDVDQRHYKDEGEKNRILTTLKEQGAYSIKDEAGLVSSICLAYKA